MVESSTTEYPYCEIVEKLKTVDKKQLLKEMKDMEIIPVYSDAKHRIEFLKAYNKIYTIHKNYGDSSVPDTISNYFKIK